MQHPVRNGGHEVAKGRLPFARSTEGERLLVAATWALPKVDYQCPECGMAVRLRRASHRAKAHYFHVRLKPPAVTRTCKPDRYTHNTAMKVLMQVVREWVDGKGAAPAVHRRCVGCDALEVHTPPSGVRQVCCDVRFKDLNRTPDVFLADERGRPLLLVEVFHTNEVSPAKASDYAGSPYTWIEVSARAVLDTPLVWVVRRGGPPWTCARCIGTQAAARAMTVQPVEVSPPTCNGPEPRLAPLRPRRSAASEAFDHRANLRARMRRRAEEIGPTVREMIKTKFPAYTVVRFAGCFECEGLTPMLTWRGQTPPEPRPSWLVRDAEGQWLFRCRGCKQPLEPASAATCSS